MPSKHSILRCACVAVVGLMILGLAFAQVMWAPPGAHAQAPKDEAGTIDISRHIRPILSENCFTCHGPDDEQRKAKFRLDTKEGAFARLRRGGFALVPGKPKESVLLQRILAEDPSERMPPPHTNKRLSPAQLELLKQWIEQGAPWAEHWAFVAPRRPALPAVKNKTWPRNGIDHFILARLEKEGLAPMPEADRATLIRRVTLDLTGLPPTIAEIDAFLADKSPDAYDKVVERLLTSPHYGERMTLDWLDAARFADTHGYHLDSGRDMSRWREWIIGAFNNDMPFDRFTIEQLAGDLLPKATLEQRIASGFNRNHMINFEGGAIAAEYLNAYIVDRVNTTATVWLGLTMACAQCHEHKYDPISQKEYYQLYAFFNNVPENGLDGSKGNAAPMLKAPSTQQEQALAKLDAELAKLEQSLKAPDAKAAEVKTQLAVLKKQRDELEKKIPSSMIMQELPQPRETFLLVRGQYDKRGEKVSAGVPAFLPPLKGEGPANRLALARWLVDPAQPLTARVTVNRLWQLFMGTGIVKTAEDFGAQGEPPSHPELLDWLATEFTGVGRGAQSANWSVKNIVRIIVTSATYRQSSKVTPNLLARDPENRLLGRGPRFRLQAEFLRDQALALSGLLNPQIGGHSVFPYQPPGLWTELSSRGDSDRWSAQKYTPGTGKDLYRRSMYTFWKRASPPPNMLTFDAPDRETCTVRRARTNTPLQALVLMNDPTFVEAARKFAERVMLEAQATDERIVFAFRSATARPPTAKEIAVLRGIYEKQHARYAADEKAALALLSVGEAPRQPQLNASEVAAWTIVATAILNLDETVTRN